MMLLCTGRRVGNDRMGRLIRHADRRVALQARVTSMLARQATISHAQFQAPPGYELQPQPPELASLLPLQVRVDRGR